MKWLKPWYLGGLAAVITVAVVAVYWVSILTASTDKPVLAVEANVLIAEEVPAARDIPVSGSLVFPNRMQLTFESTGKVGEVLVREGDRVEAGQPIARLDGITVSELGQKLSQARFDLDAAEEALDAAREEFKITPLEQAEFKEKVAQAEQDVDDAERGLADFRRDYLRDLAAARKAKVEAEVALDDTLREVGYYDRDQVLALANAANTVATRELALETARQQLANFDVNYSEALANARLTRANAEAAFDTADESLEAFLRNPSRDYANNQNIDREILLRLQDALEEASTNLKQSQDALTNFQANRELDLQEKMAAVPKAETDLAKAKDDLIKIRDVASQSLEIRARLARVEDAEANLAQATTDLEKEADGPDQLKLAVREQSLIVTQQKLTELTDGPDLLDVALKEEMVAAAWARVDDARKELEGSTVRAPFAGIISLVNVDVDDQVNDQSKLIEIIDTTKLEVAGLVDAIDIAFVAEGARSKISIESLDEQNFEGSVIQVAPEPRTERGVVSYPVRIKVDLPNGINVPVELSSVTSVVTYQPNVFENRSP
jgi:multidrug resistance efflux pump